MKAQLDDKKAVVAAQNISEFPNGAYTGEVSAEMLKDFGIKWTIIGHSERRTYFHESDEVVAKKVTLALEQELSVILCIGERLEEREAEQTNEVIAKQLAGAKDAISDWKKIVVAYEPVWAIGTGKVATPEQAQEAHAFIRDWIKTNVSEEVANATRLIYGGSVNEKNCTSLIEQADVDGFLVGGASIKPAFGDIVEAAHEFATRA